jgi:tetratricopeptide (TPR) repeat protein
MAEGEKCLRRALELDPATILALVYLSQLYSATGRLDEALSIAQRTAVVDPVSPIVGVQVGILMYAQRRFADAEIAFRNVLHRERNFALAHYYLGLNSAYRGKFDEAVHHLSQADLHPGVLRTDRAWLALLQGDRTPAESVYRDLQTAVQAGKTNASAVVLLAAWLGRLDDAFVALEIAARERHPELLMLQSDPRLDPLRGDQRYRQLLKRLKLDVRNSVEL